MFRAKTWRWVAAWAALSSASCSLGGQTYDDGSDEVKRTNNDKTDAGAVGPEPAPGKLSCDTLARDASDQRIEIAANADTSCESAADCVEVNTAPSCIDPCNKSILVNEQSLETIKEQVDALSNSVCQDFSDGGCSFVPVPCGPPPLGAVTCQDGECAYGRPGDCDALALEATAALNDEVAVLDRSCSADEDCTAVATGATCADNCGRVIVGNAESLTDSAALVATACRAFDNTGCTLPAVPCPASVPITDTHCEAGQCVLGAAPATKDCFGPDQNLDRAYDGSIPGCACENVGDICVDGAALICDGGTWNAVIDGPCYPDAIDLACDGRVASAQTCVELFDHCRDLDNALFCGTGRRTSLCDDGEIVESSSDCLQDSAYCVELENGLYCTGSDAGGPIDTAQCEGRGGQVFSDPGDGSLSECPDGRATLATVSGCIEGCLCCGFAPGETP
jgi:hypothetical protein